MLVVKAFEARWNGDEPRFFKHSQQEGVPLAVSSLSFVRQVQQLSTDYVNNLVITTMLRKRHSRR